MQVTGHQWKMVAREHQPTLRIVNVNLAVLEHQGGVLLLADHPACEKKTMNGCKQRFCVALFPIINAAVSR